LFAFFALLFCVAVGAYLLPAASDEYEFELSGAAWVQFWIDNEIVVSDFLRQDSDLNDPPPKSDEQRLRRVRLQQGKEVG
jgi:hypothetical protein